MIGPPAPCAACGSVPSAAFYWLAVRTLSNLGHLREGILRSLYGGDLPIAWCSDCYAVQVEQMNDMARRMLDQPNGAHP